MTVQTSNEDAVDEPRPAVATTGAAHANARSAFVGEVLTRYGLLIVWAALIVVFTVLAPGLFMTGQNIGNIFGSQAVLLIVALGLMTPVIAGEWDLSVGATVGLSLTLVGSLNAVQGWPIGWAVVVAVLAGVVVGALNACAVVLAKVPSLIATLGMATLLNGVTYAISNTTVAGLDSDFVAFGQHQILHISTPFYLAIAVALVVWYVHRWTPGGRYLFFVGSNRDVARLSGVRVDRVRTVSLVVAGAISGLAGVVLASSLGAAGPQIGSGYLLPAFAAVFLGSTVLSPGRINVWGTVIAVYFLITGVSGIQLLGAQSWVQDVCYGGILVVAVALSKLAKKK